MQLKLLSLTGNGHNLRNLRQKIMYQKIGITLNIDQICPLTSHLAL